MTHSCGVIVILAHHSFKKMVYSSCIVAFYSRDGSSTMAVRCERFHFDPAILGVCTLHSFSSQYSCSNFVCSIDLLLRFTKWWVRIYVKAIDSEYSMDGSWQSTSVWVSRSLSRAARTWSSSTKAAPTVFGPLLLRFPISPLPLADLCNIWFSAFDLCRHGV